MTKTEILEAINSVIVSNDQKGITAEVLANILAEIVNATPEGYTLEVGHIGTTGAADLTAEQKANNAKIYDVVKSGANVTIFLAGDGVSMPASIVVTSEDKVEMFFAMPDYFVAESMDGHMKVIFLTELFADGSVNVISMIE